MGSEVNVKFWGVRGSIPTPLSAQQIQAKISAAIQRITPDDIKSSDSRERFIASLPSWIFGTTGGNTPCVELTSAANEKIIFDAGTGIRVMGKLGQPAENLHYNLFFSHFHWDHIQGLPFFDYIYNPSAKFDIYSPFEKMEEYLKKQMVAPYYPVDWSVVSKNMKFHILSDESEQNFNGVSVSFVKMNHPGTSYSYAVCENGKKFVYGTDVELLSSDFDTKNKALARVFENADAVVIDSQYTVEEAMHKVNWGHSAFCYAVDFAVAWKIKNLYLYHHEPMYDDKKLNSILESARWYSDYVSGGKIQIQLAYEGMEIQL